MLRELVNQWEALMLYAGRMLGESFSFRTNRKWNFLALITTQVTRRIESYTNPVTLNVNSAKMAVRISHYKRTEPPNKSPWCRSFTFPISNDKLYVVTCAFHMKGRWAWISCNEHWRVALSMKQGMSKAFRRPLGLKAGSSYLAGASSNTIISFYWRRSFSIGATKLVSSQFLNNSFSWKQQLLTLRSGSLSFSTARILLTCSLPALAFFPLLCPFSHPPWIKIHFSFSFFSFQVRDARCHVKCALELS